MKNWVFSHNTIHFNILIKAAIVQPLFLCVVYTVFSTGNGYFYYNIYLLNTAATAHAKD